MDWLMTILTYGVIAPLGVIGVFLVLVTIHELGHYAVGRYFGVGAEEFSIGFGPILLARSDRRGTRWSIRAFPLGGFVKFVGDADASSRPDPEQAPMDARVDALSGIALWQRALVVAAGPIANILLAFVLLFANYAFIGAQTQPAIFAAPAPDSEAMAAGIQPLDQVLEFEGREISGLDSLNRAFEARLGQESRVLINRDGQTVELSLTPQPGFGELPSLTATGLQPLLGLRVAAIRPSTPAQEMDLRVGDVILGYDGQFLTSAEAFAAAREAKVGQSMVLQIDRQGEILDLEGRPERQEIELPNGEVVTMSLFGANLGPALSRERLGILASGRAALRDIREFSLLIFRLPGQFINSQRSLDDLGGPVRIASEVGTVVVSLPTLILFLAGLLSLQLGILNLLPIPILDGGHLLLYSAEGILRRPLPAALIQILYRMGGLVLLAFFILVTFNDLQRFLLP